MDAGEEVADERDHFHEVRLEEPVAAVEQVELGVRQGWDRYIGVRGDMLGIDRFGASAPAKALLENYGFTVDNVVALINLMALLSLNIGVFNLLSIPMLDGGHLVYYGIEALRGRPLSQRVQEIGFRFGLALVFMLMAFTLVNDIF